MRFPRTRRIGLTAKTKLAEKERVIERVLAVLHQEGVEVFVDEAYVKDIRCVRTCRRLTAKSPIDLLIVIGGDGTIFRAVRDIAASSVPLIAINRGGVGFLAEIDLEEIEDVLPLLLHGKGMIEERHLLSVKVQRDRKNVFEGLALNEAVIAQGAIARLMSLQTCVGGETLTTYRADGLIIATPTGSTAYNLSAGGPIVHPRLPAVILTPINPHSFSQKPIVLPGDMPIEVKVVQKNSRYFDTEISLTLDGQIYHKLDKHDRILARMHPKPAKFLRRRQDTFFATLRSKLKWGEAPEA